MSETTRRSVLAGAAGVSAAAALTACGGGGDSSSGGTPANTGTPAAGGTTGGGGGATLGKTSDVPVGSGKIFTDQQVVVTQPTAGEFKAFTAVCTHNQCLVTSIANGTIICPCHGSKYAIADGSVKDGPAPAPLPAKTVKVEGGNLVLG